MKDLYDAGHRGHLPLLMQNFLSDRSFRVRVGNTYSNVYSQEMCVPHVSAVYYLLHYFPLRLITLLNVYHLVCSVFLYIDNFVISYSSAYLNTAERQVQQCLDSLQQWSNENSFMFPRLRQFVFTFVVREDYT